MRDHTSVVRSYIGCETIRRLRDNTSVVRPYIGCETRPYVGCETIHRLRDHTSVARPYVGCEGYENGYELIIKWMHTGLVVVEGMVGALTQALSPHWSSCGRGHGGRTHPSIAASLV